MKNPYISLHKLKPKTKSSLAATRGRARGVPGGPLPPQNFACLPQWFPQN